METIEEQRVCVKFCFKLGKSSSETFKLLKQAFGDDVLSRTTCFEWFKRFKEGRSSTKDNERSGRPSTSKTNEIVARVREIIRNNRRLTIREVAEDVGISYGSCQKILTKELELETISSGTSYDEIHVDNSEAYVAANQNSNELGSHKPLVAL
ncbi:protein GVQW3-like [Daktulosphaira vitifoliae]|uniref:protein GVQW3-like n=1 Tax=Daktulosphaira vitifoliae TaxID=58002 RepID=UPI0021AA6994|nr:protein GVQW3-like [Daktulosphaira vitifoliae]